MDLQYLVRFWLLVPFCVADDVLNCIWQMERLVGGSELDT